MLTEFWQKIDTLNYISWEILSVSLQFLWDGRKQWECAVGFLHILSTDMQSILDGNKKVLLFYELDPLCCIGFGFNGTSLMWDRLCRVQAIMHEKYVNAQYVHCSGHRLNLISVQTFSNTSAAKEFFDAAGQLPITRDSDTRSLLDILKAMDQDISPALYKFYCALVTCPQTSCTAGRMISSMKWVTSSRHCSMTMHTGKLCPLSFERDLSLNLNYDEIIQHWYKVRGHDWNAAATCTFARVRVSRMNIAGSVEKGKEVKDAMPHRFSGTFHGLLEVNSHC